jgi:hypothetical protein
MRGVFVIEYTVQFPPHVAAFIEHHPIVFTNVGDFQVTLA